MQRDTLANAPRAGPRRTHTGRPNDACIAAPAGPRRGDRLRHVHLQRLPVPRGGRRRARVWTGCSSTWSTARADESDLLPLLHGRWAPRAPRRSSASRLASASASGAPSTWAPAASWSRRSTRPSRPAAWPAGCAPSRPASAASPYSRAAWTTARVGHDGVAGRHEDLLAIVQIESRAALDEVEAIAGGRGHRRPLRGPHRPHARAGHPRPDRPSRPTGTPCTGRAGLPERPARRPGSCLVIPKMWDATRPWATFFALVGSQYP